MIWLVASAFAGAHPELTVQVGARTAPESSIQVPVGWEGHFDPSGLLSADGELTLDLGRSAWLDLGLRGWGYVPDFDASSAGTTLGAGAAHPVGGATLEGEARLDTEAFPGIPGAGNLRGDAFLRLRSPAARPLTGALTARAVVRTFPAAEDANYTFAELDARGAAALGPAWTLRLGVAGEVNSPGWWGDGLPGTQVRPRLALAWQGKHAFVEAEYRFVAAFGGEVDPAERAAFTPLADYADDADALSSDGFTQHRLGMRFSRDLGAWRLSGAAFYRVRTYTNLWVGCGGLLDFCAPSNGEATVASVQLRVESPGWDPAVHPFAAVGVSTVQPLGVDDAWGWLGLTWRPAPPP